jgi:hypothetical protein
MKVKLVGKKGLRHWEADGKLVIWSSGEAVEAQDFLALRQERETVRKLRRLRA